MKYILAILFGKDYVNKAIVPFVGGKKTVNTALIHFNKALADLEAVEKAEAAEAERKKQEIAEAQAALAASTAEATRARNVAGRIRSLLGEDLDDAPVNLRVAQFDAR